MVLAGYSHQAEDRNKRICSTFSASKRAERQVSRSCGMLKKKVVIIGH
jgi:hypothetical protein